MDYETFVCVYCGVTVHVPYCVSEIREEDVGCPLCGYPQKVVFFPSYLQIDYYREYDG